MKYLKKFQYNAPVVLTFALVSLIVLGIGNLTDGESTLKFFCVYRSSFLDPLTYIRLFTHVLGHADLSHYTNNMLLLLLVGPMLEEKYKSKLILQMILITAVVTGIIHNIFFPTTGLLGASGIVFMMILLASMASAKEGRIPLTLVVTLIIYLGQEIVDGVFTKDNISQLTHIIGGICGVMFGRLYISHSKKKSYL